MNEYKFSERDMLMCHSRFNSGHAQLKNQLLGSLPGEAPIKVDFRASRFVRRAVAVAAVVFLSLTLAYFNTSENPGFSATQAAWASVLDHVGKVESIHVKMITPSKNSSPSMEMWWRQGDDFRMEFDNGMVNAGSGGKRYSLDPKTNTLKISLSDGPGPELWALGDLGGLFNSDTSLSGNRHRAAQVVSAEKVDYRGEACLKVTTQDGDCRYEYIMDIQPDIADMPLYEVRFYSGENYSKLRYRLVVLELNRQYPDSLFVVEPGIDTVVKSRF